MNQKARILSLGETKRRGEMNKTETAYAEILQAGVLTGQVSKWWFEPFTLRISHPPAGNTQHKAATYTPDFMVLYPDGRTCIDDTKGSKRGVNEAAIVRIKAAAEIFPLWEFRICTRLPQKQGGGFEIVTV